jgi:hypothetical protein
MTEVLPYIFFVTVVILFVSLLYFHGKAHKKFIKESNERWGKILERIYGRNKNMEVRTEVNTILVEKICDKCEKGKMVATGKKLLSFPPLYVHKCNFCDHEETFRDIIYPHYEYEKIK